MEMVSRVQLEVEHTQDCVTGNEETLGMTKKVDGRSGMKDKLTEERNSKNGDIRICEDHLHGD